MNIIALAKGSEKFIGSHVVDHDQDRAGVVVLDNFRTGSRRNLKGSCDELIEGSVTKCDDV